LQAVEKKNPFHYIHRNIVAYQMTNRELIS